jgi:hypothetical protein
MTTLTTTCKGCGRELTVPERYQGRDLKCPSCGRTFRVEPPLAETPQLEPFVTARPLPEAAAPFPSVPPPAPFAEQPATSDEPALSATVETATVYWQLKNLDILSTGFIGAVVNAFLGLIAGLVVAVVSFTPAWIALPFARGPLTGVLAIVVLPLVYGVVGFVSGVVLATLYNLAARLVGGVKLLLE